MGILTGHQLLHLQMATKHVLYGNGRVLNWSNIKWGEEAFVKVQLLQLLTSFCPLSPLDGHNRFCRSGRQAFPVSTGSLDGCRNDQIRHQREAAEDRGRPSLGKEILGIRCLLYFPRWRRWGFWRCRWVQVPRHTILSIRHDSSSNLPVGPCLACDSG